MSETATIQPMAEEQAAKWASGKRPVTADKAAVIAMLRAEGMNTKAIAQTLGLSTGTVYNAESILKRNGHIPLLSRKRIKNATLVLDTFMQGKPIGRVVGEEIDPETNEKKVIDPGVYPKCSTVKACADSVLDRAYPKAQEDAGKGNISYTQINISLATVDPAPPILDITPDSSTT